MAKKERYSKVVRRIWNDERFRRLSPIPPCGQGLMLRLLIAPECHVVPGLFQAWEAGLAQALGWPLRAFRKAFAEAEEQKMVRADWKAGLVWLPKAIRHNEPQSPNVAVGWRKEWPELPECILKSEAEAFIQAYLDGMGEAFGKAFRIECAQPLAIQEQEQEQEQEQDPLAGGRAAAGSVFDSDEETRCPLDLLDWFSGWDEISNHTGVPIETLKRAGEEFMGYWTVGAGMGKKRNHWARKLRQDLLRKYEMGKLTAAHSVAEAL